MSKAAIGTDDVPNAGDKYTWTKASEVPLQDFLTKYRPSMVQNDGTKPWIWAEGSDAPKRDVNKVDAHEEAQAVLKEVTGKIKAIQEDPSIPTRSNKKTGARSKKELREETQAEATNKLKGIAIKYNYVCGKWLIFAPSDKVDLIWTNIAKSLVSGPLSTTVASLAKVSTSSEHETPNYQHIICVYVPDVYDKEAVVEVMKVLLRNHGATLSGVKSDLYTAIGIDSKHPSGIPSTVWKNTALLQDSEIKALKDEFFANLDAKKTDGSSSLVEGSHASNAPTIEQTTKAGHGDSQAKPKSKPKPKKKTAKDDPFASEDDDQEQEEEKKRKESLKVKKAPKRNKPASDQEDDEEEEKPKAKRTKTTRK